MATRRTRAEIDFVTKYTGRSNLTRLSTDIGSATRVMKRMAGTALAVGGIAGLGYVTKQTMAAIDANAKLSDRLDMTTESLIGLQHAGKINGVEQATTNKSLEVFVKRLGEVDMGVGQARYALDKLGLSADELANKSPDEAIGIVADQINRLETQAQKAAAANYLFGRSGQQLLNLFDQGSAGIAEYQKEVERLGLTYSRIDAANVEAANDAMARMKASMQGVVNQAVIQMAPHIEALADLMTDTMTSGVDMGGAITGAFAGMTTSSLRFAKTLVDIEIMLKSIKSGATTGLTSYLTKGEIRKQALARYRAVTGDDGKYKFLGITFQGQQVKDLKKLQEITRQLRAETMVDVRDPAMERARDLARSLDAQIAAVEKFFATIDQKKADRVTRYGDRVTPGILPDPVPDPVAVQTAADTEVQIVQQATVDITAARARMFGEFDRMTVRAYHGQKALLDQQLADYEKLGIDKLAIDAWYAEQSIKLEIERLKASDRVADGFMAASLQIDREQQTWGERAHDIAMSTRDIWRQGLMDIARDWESMGDVAMDVMEQIYWRSIQTAFVNPAADALTAGLSAGVSGLFGGASKGLIWGNGEGAAVDYGGEMHRGGIVGASSGVLRAVPAGTFHGAPRLHNGLAPDEFPAILQHGERVIPRGGSGGTGDVQVQVYLVGDGRGQVTTEQSSQNGQRTVTAVIHDSQQGGMTAREIKRQARRVL